MYQFCVHYFINYSFFAFNVVQYVYYFYLDSFITITLNLFDTFVQIMRSSAGNVKRSKVEADADPEQEDDYGYTTSKYYFIQIY